MQPSIKNDLVYLLQILESVGKIEIYSEEFSDSTDFFRHKDQINFNASLMLLANIGDQVSKISDELKSKHAGIDWINIKGLRNRITHDYSGLDFITTFQIIKMELPSLKDALIKILQSEIRSGNFNLEEVNVAKSSIFYQHIDFDPILS